MSGYSTYSECVVTDMIRLGYRRSTFFFYYSELTHCVFSTIKKTSVARNDILVGLEYYRKNLNITNCKLITYLSSNYTPQSKPFVPFVTVFKESGDSDMVDDWLILKQQ